MYSEQLQNHFAVAINESKNKNRAALSRPGFKCIAQTTTGVCSLDCPHARWAQGLFHWNLFQKTSQRNPE